MLLILVILLKNEVANRASPLSQNIVYRNNHNHKITFMKYK